MTPNKEDFLKALYEIDGENQVITNKKLASRLDVSPASVTEMNSRLLKENLIEYTPYKGVQLTSKGVRIANQLVRKHRLWEVFLAEKLAYSWNEVHQDADLLEHVSSDKLINRLDQFLGFPKFDPHGDVIPNPDGTIDQQDFIPLFHASTTDQVIIQRVDDESEFLKYLSQKGIKLGDKYELVDIEPYEGPITLKNQEKKIIISYKAGQRILVSTL